jgi:hypothetical protein
MSDPITYNPAPSGGQPPVQYQPQGEPPQPESRGKAVAKGVGKALLWRLVGLAVVLLIGGGVFVYKYMSGNITAKTPTVGECVTAAKSDKDVENVETVDCGSAQAADKVVGVLADKTEAQANVQDEDTFECRIFPTTQTWIWMESSKGSGKGTILCLTPAK